MTQLGVNTCPAIRTSRDGPNTASGSLAPPFHPNPDGWYAPGNQAMIDKDIALAKSLGARYLRFDFPWIFMETASGVYDFARADYIVNALNAAGITPTPFIFCTPTWINPNPTVAPSPAQMSSFAGAVATHFKGRVKFIEIWNEADHGGYWNSGWTTYGSAALGPSYDAIKAVDPSIQVILSGASQGANTVFWQNAADGAGHAKFDILAAHAYGVPCGSIVSAAKTWLASLGRPSVPIWIGEVGAATAHVPPGDQIATLNEAFNSKADVVEWYNLRDDWLWNGTGTVVASSGAGWGLVNHDYTHKSADSAALFATLAGTTPPPPPPPPPPPGPPVAAFSVGTSVAGSSTSFDASATTNATTYAWSFGDAGTGTGVTVSHTYANAGTYSVMLTATGTGGTNSLIKVVAVSAVLPPPPPPPPPPPVTGLAVSIKGGKFVDANGAVLQLRGVNVSALEFVAAQGWSAGDPWGGVKPNWSAIASWKANTVRIPLNSQSWLGVNGTDPGNNYRATVQQAVTDAHAAGFYVILDLHWTAPTTNKALAQQAMPTTDHDIDFWTSLANTFKNDPAVIFELYNEPFQYGDYYSGDPLTAIYTGGGNVIKFLTGGATYTAACNSPVASFTQMLAAVRATGATNVVLVGGYDWCSAMDKWLAMAPKDPQVGAAWHPYPGQPQPTSWPQDKTSVPAILAAGYPVVATETGDHNTPGTVGSPFVSSLLPWLDNLGISYTPWTWDVWQNPDNVLIKDAAGTPTDGYGQYVKQHFIDMAGGIVPPPPPAPVPPIAAFTFTAGATAGSTVSFDASSSSDVDDAITAYAWDFGDGTMASGVKVNHVFVAAGNFTVKLTATDASALTSLVGHVVTVAPVIPPPPPPPTSEVLTFSITDGTGRKGSGVITLT